MSGGYQSAGRWAWRLVWACGLGLLLFLSGRAEGQVADRLFKRTAAQLNALSPSETDRRRVYICSDCLDDSSCTVGGGSEENLCKWDGSAWVVVGAGGGGSGDITSVWDDTTGDVSALTAASGDSLDCGSADSCSPATRSTSLPGTCAEGQFHQDTDATAGEVYYCSATNTWTLLLAAVSIDTSAEFGAILTDETGTGAIVRADSPAFTTDATIDGDQLCREDGTNCPGAFATIEYHPDSYPVSSLLADEFTGDTPALTWTQQNADSQTVTYLMDGVLLDEAGTTDAWHGITTPAPADSGVDWLFAAKITMLSTGALGATQGCGISIVHGGSAASPAEINSIYFRFTGATAAAVEHLDHDDYDFTGSTGIASMAVVSADAEARSWGTRSSYFALEWRDSAEDIAAHWSSDGVAAWPLGNDSSTDGYPVAIALFSRDDRGCFFEWARVISNAGSAAMPASRMIKVGS